MTAPQVHVSYRPVYYVLLLAALVTLPRALLIQRAHSESSDDDYHLVRGLEFLHHDPGLVHRELNDPPLGEAITALPLYFMGGQTHGSVEGSALYGQPYTPETALQVIAIWKSLLFLPLIVIVFLWCRRLHGPSAAWLAAAMLLIEPTLAAHLHLASLDVLATTAIVVACFVGWRYLESPTTARLLAAAFACSAALLIKHTAVLVPIILCAYAILFRQPGTLRNLINAALVSLLALWLLLSVDVSAADGKHAMPAGLYIRSLLDAARHIAAPNDAYLFGQTRRGGWWYYFPAVAYYKVPIALAVILALALVSLIKSRPKRQEWSLLLPLLAYVALLMLQNINIGWRHFLPAYVLLTMFASRCLIPGAQFCIAPWIALAFLAINSARWHPDYFAYSNHSRPDLHLRISDSNIDWGQGLKQARDWIDDNAAFIAGRPVYLRAFATSNRAIRHYLGDRVTRLDPGDSPPRSGILIVSPVALAGVSESADEYAFLRRAHPYAVVGHALHVYDFDRLDR